MDPDLRQRLIRAFALAAVGLGALIFSGVLGTAPSLHLSNIAQVLAPLGAALGCWSASRRAVLTAERRAWRFIGASAASWCCGQIVWTAYELTGVASPFPSLADVGYLLAVPLALVGVWSLTMRASTAVRLVALVDGLIIAGSLLAIAWPLVLAPSWRAGNDDTTALVLSIVYPVASLMIASSILLALVRSSRFRGAVPLLSLTGALVTLAVADSLFVWEVTRGTGEALGFADVGWFAGYTFLLLASLQYPMATDPATAHRRDATTFRRALLPLTIAGIALLVRIVLIIEGQEVGIVLSALTVVVGVLVLLRHLMTMRENQHLTDELEDKIDELTAGKEQLSHQAFHDPLTGLANRRLFSDRVNHALQRSRRTGERTAVMFIDLDDFKTVNDSLGHGAGDRLLTAVAARVSGCVRPGDTVARLGGDEFGVLLEELEGPDQAAVVAARVLDALDVSLSLDGRQVFTRASIGVAHAETTDLPDGDHLLADADVALYAAKEAGKATFRIFEGSMRRSAVARLELSQELRRNLDTDQFTCHFQPIVELATGRVAALEGLARWRHPQRGLLTPDAFIEMAEEIGSINEIGLQVLRVAATEMARWRAAGDVAADVDLHANLSGRQLGLPGLAGDVAAILAEAGLPPERLVIEITESVAVDIAAHHLVRLEDLRSLGVRLAIDDFGTGYSSLSYLRTLPVDALKVDRAFARPSEGPTDLLLLEAIVKLGQALGIEVVAEGIETEDQALLLETLGCELAQGYYFSRPVSADDVPGVVLAAEAV